MKFTTVIVGALASTASAHFDPRDIYSGIPKLMGGRKFLSELKARNALPAPLAAPPVYVEERQPAEENTLEERQNVNGQCGPGFGSCAVGSCCSPAG